MIPNKFYIDFLQGLLGTLLNFFIVSASSGYFLNTLMCIYNTLVLENTFFLKLFGGPKWPQMTILANQCVTHQKTIEILGEFDGGVKKTFFSSLCAIICK